MSNPLIDSFKFAKRRILKKREKRADDEERVNELCLNETDSIDIDSVVDEPEEIEKKTEPEEKTRYTDEECYNMIKNGCVPYDAPRWVRAAVENKRLKILRESTDPVTDTENWLKSKGASNVG